MFRLVVICGCLMAAANGGLISTGLIGGSGPVGLHSAALGLPSVSSSSSNIIRGYGNLGAISASSNSVDTAFSSGRNADVRITNPGIQTTGYLSYAATAPALAAAPLTLGTAPAGYALASAGIAASSVGLGSNGAGVNGYGVAVNGYGAGVNGYGLGASAYGVGVNGYGAGANAYGAGVSGYGLQTVNGLGLGHGVGHGLGHGGIRVL